MTDPQKKSNWNELAEQIGAATPPQTAPDPTPKKPVEAATPPPPPKRPPAPVKKSGWGAIASLLGIESAPPVEEPAAAETQGKAPQAEPPAAAPPAPAVVETKPEPVARQDDWARQHEDTQPEVDDPFATSRHADVVTESSSATDKSSSVTSDSAEEPTVGSRGSSRGRRRRGGQPRADESRDGAGAASQEPVARSEPSETELAASFADDDDPLLLRDTFVDEVEISYDDLTDSIDNAEDAPPSKAEEERPKKRRRRGRRRGRRDGASTSAAGENTGEATAETADEDRVTEELVSEDRVSEALGEALPSDSEEKMAGDDGGAKPKAGERTTRKRRRGRRRRGGKREESAADDAKTSETTEISAKTGSDATPPVAGESYDDDYDDAADLEEFDASEENGEAETRHRKIPTWSDAIGDIVDKNLATRSKNPNPSRRGRGGRGRQGDRSSK